ncbi:MAG TPA: DNA polymerase Y family protein [Longimicrobiales bacterium]|nr:DNA polymerase Y family protein [Longimicrobiales bacterium]
MSGTRSHYTTASEPGPNPISGDDGRTRSGGQLHTTHTEEQRWTDRSGHRSPRVSRAHGPGGHAPSRGPHSSSRATPGRGSRRALCLWLPTFELRLELVRSPELDATSVALLSTEGGVRRSVWQVSERAHEAGVRPGQLVSQAVSLCPALTLLEPDPAHYDAAQEAMLEALAELTPVLEPAGRGRVFLGMDGLGRLYGSPPTQAHRALRCLFQVFPAPLVAATRAGYAPGKFGAWVAAARAAPGQPVVVAEEELRPFLAGCPVSALPVDGTMIQRLERLGVATLGELVRLPEAALVGQFGEEGRDALARAAGRRVDPVRPWHRPRPIRVSLDLPAPVGQTAPLHGALDRLLERALSRPARRGRSVAALRLGARLEGGGSWTAEQVLREPSARRKSLAFALRSRIALSPPPRAVETLVLELTRFGPPDSQEELFARDQEGGRSAGGRDLAEGEVPPSLRKAVKELKLRLGHSPLYRVVEMDPWSRIPERRHALLSFDP